MNLFQMLLDRLAPPHRTVPAGIYHFQSSPEIIFPYRLHLRIEPDGSGILMVNAQTILHLNQTAAEYAYYLVQKIPEDELVERVSKRYPITKEQARHDYIDLVSRIDTLITTRDLDPEEFLEFDRRDPYTTKISAPYRLDCAITYQVSTPGSEKFAPLERVKHELTESEWKTILSKAWKAGIPHIIFTGGEPTLRKDLPELIAFAEQQGQVTGLLTDGFLLVDDDYLESLLKKGLDHLMLILETNNPVSWEALAKSLAKDIFVTVHLTISTENVNEINSLFDRLAQMGVKSLSLSVNTLDLKESIRAASQAAAERSLSLKWDLPVPYSHLHPVALELADFKPVSHGAGQAFLYVEPDGDVLPAQGITQVLGNMLSDPWESIWAKRSPTS